MRNPRNRSRRSQLSLLQLGSAVLQRAVLFATPAGELAVGARTSAGAERASAPRANQRAAERASGRATQLQRRGAQREAPVRESSRECELQREAATMRVGLSLLGCHNSGCHKAQHSTKKCIMYMLATTARPNRYEIPRRRARQLAGPAAHCMMANNAVPSKAARPICARASRAPLLSTVRTERSALLREQVGQSRSAGECTRWAWGGGRRGCSFVWHLAGKSVTGVAAVAGAGE